MQNRSFEQGNTVVVVISFEGPDPSSQAGGLGVRVTGLTQTLAELGFETHLFFMGDPERPGVQRVATNLTLHRWGQWLSRFHPRGVYDGEEAKRADMVASLPPWVTQNILLPAIRAGRVPIVLSEEWQTAECATRIADILASHGVRDRAVLAWNANNPYSFERIDWRQLAATNTITTVSRYMRSIIRARGVDARVTPNGIPQRLTKPVSRLAVTKLCAAFQGTPFFFKMARWEHEKGWMQALDAIALLRDRGRRTLLLSRSGGPSGAGGNLGAEAEARGLRVLEVHSEKDLVIGIREALHRGVHVLSLRFGVSESLARVLYACADGVLANSVSEPFGLAGLEAMAAGGVIYTGGTGEDYAVSGRNSVVLQTLDPAEIADAAQGLAHSPHRVQRIRRAARQTARSYTWPDVTTLLLRLLELQARRQGNSVRWSADRLHVVDAAAAQLPQRPAPARISGSVVPA